MPNIYGHKKRCALNQSKTDKPPPPPKENNYSRTHYYRRKTISTYFSFGPKILLKYELPGM